MQDRPGMFQGDLSDNGVTVMGDRAEPSRARPTEERPGTRSSRAGTNLSRAPSSEGTLIINILETWWKYLWWKNGKYVGVRMINHNMTHINQYSSSADYLLDSLINCLVYKMLETSCWQQRMFLIGWSLSGLIDWLIVSGTSGICGAVLISIDEKMININN